MESPRAGFKNKDLIPVKHTSFAANKEHIPAILLHLCSLGGNRRNCTAAVIVYVRPATNRFYLSRDPLIQLSITNPNLPQLDGSTLQQSAINSQKHLCEYPECTKPPSCPKSLPFGCIPTNNEKLYKWILERFSTSAFNQCSHQQPPEVTVPEISVHVNKNTVPHTVRTPALLKLQWQESAKTQLDNGVAMGIREKIPIGKPSRWFHQMIITPKSDGISSQCVVFEGNLLRSISF